MWVLIFTATITLLVLMGLHHGYEYLKRTLTIQKVHDLETIESRKRLEIDSILEET